MFLIVNQASWKLVPGNILPYKKDCLELDKDYFGYDLASYPDVPSVWDCKELCRAYPNGECKVFTYRMLNNSYGVGTVCYLKTSAANAGYHSGHVSAPLQCPPVFIVDEEEPIAFIEVEPVVAYAVAKK